MYAGILDRFYRKTKELTEDEQGAFRSVWECVDQIFN